MTSLVNFLKDASLGNFYKGGTVPVVPTTASSSIDQHYRPIVKEMTLQPNDRYDIKVLFPYNNMLGRTLENQYGAFCNSLADMLAPPTIENNDLYVMGEICIDTSTIEKFKKNRDVKLLSDEHIKFIFAGLTDNKKLQVFRYILPIKKTNDITTNYPRLSYVVTNSKEQYTVPKKLLCYGSEEGAVTVLDAETKKKVWEKTPKKKYRISCVAISTDTRKLCVGMGNELDNNNSNFLQLYDVIDGTFLVESKKLQIKNGNKRINSVLFMDNAIVSGDDDGYVIFWNPDTLEEKRNIKVGVSFGTNIEYQVASLVHLNKIIFAGCWVKKKRNMTRNSVSGAVITIDTNKHFQIQKYDTNGQVNSLAIFNDQYLAVATDREGSKQSDNGYVHVYKLQNQMTLTKIKQFINNEDITAVAFIKNGTTLVYGTVKNNVKVIENFTAVRPPETNFNSADYSNACVNGIVTDNDNNIFVVTESGMFFINNLYTGTSRYQGPLYQANNGCVAYIDTQMAEVVGNDSHNFVSYKIDYDSIEKDNIKELLKQKIGEQVSIKNIGVTCGRPFFFPKWIRLLQRKKFVATYNNTGIYRSLPGLTDNQLNVMFYLNGGDTLLKEVKDLQRSLYTFWEKEWISIIHERRDIKEWVNTFDIALLSNYKYSSMALYTLYGKIIYDQTGLQYSEIAEIERNDPHATLVYPTTDLLLPVPLERKGTRGTISWSGLEDKKVIHSKGNNPIPPEHTRWTFKVNAEDNLPNIYMHLRAANGGQGIEHVVLSSFLGSGTHTSAALQTIEYKVDGSIRDIVTGFSSTPDNLKHLDSYEKALPRIVHAVANRLDHVTIRNDGGNDRQPHTYIRAVEFPVHYFAHKINDMYIYSRMDAISENFFNDQEGYAIWEYKTRWGAKLIQDNAEEGDIRQTAFYCFCANRMLPADKKVKFFYIRYAHVVNPPADFNRTGMNIYTFRYRYAPDTSNRTIWNAETHYDFLTQIQDYQNKTPK